jgi:predicted glycosyltransferase
MDACNKKRQVMESMLTNALARVPDETMGAGLKAMFYCHDTYGLGHLRRTLTLAHHFRKIRPEISQLIVTGSPIASSFTYPDGADFIKLPSVTKTADGTYESRTLESIDIDGMRDLRQALLLAAAKKYQPDFLIVDHAPAGLKGEVVETLLHLKRHLPDTRLVLGLRDVMDEASTVRESWIRAGVYELFDDVYDRIFVYGHRDFYDVIEEYGISEKAADKTRFVGYLHREAGRRTREEIRKSINMQTEHLVLVTAGGGGDGRTLFEAMIRDLEATRQHDFDTLIVGGPLLSRDDREELRVRLGDHGNVHILPFTDDLPGYIGAADAVIGMGGYNTVCESLSLRRPTLIVPRVAPRKEQLIRATFLEQRGYVSMLHPRELELRRLISGAFDLLEHGDSRPALPMHGLTNMVDELDQERASQILERS